MPSSYTAVKPANFSTLPVARNVNRCAAAMSAVVWSNTAGAICDATKRSQMSW